MIEPNHNATSRAWSWRHAVGKSGLPPTTRLVLHTLGLKMDATGGSCYPPVSELVELTGLDKKTVLKHLEIAQENGWIDVTPHGFGGQRWKRNEYVARWPGRELSGHATSVDTAQGGGPTPPPSELEKRADFGVEGGGPIPPPLPEKVGELTPEGGGIDDHKVVEPLHQDKILPANIPKNSPAAAVAGEAVLRKSEKNRIELEFTVWFATWKTGAPDFARNAWMALSPDERAQCIDRTPAYLRWIKGDRMAGAVYLKGRHWQDVPDEVVSAPQRGVAKVCGKLWIGTRFVALSKEPTGILVVTGYDQRQIDRGEISREEVLRGKRLLHGWPVVAAMREAAQRSEPYVTSLELLPLVSDFRQVERGTALFAAWERLHHRLGWPFPEPRNQYIWFPAIADGASDLDHAVADALNSFLLAAREAGHDHAA